MAEQDLNEDLNGNFAKASSMCQVNFVLGDLLYAPNLGIFRRVSQSFW